MRDERECRRYTKKDFVRRYSVPIILVVLLLLPVAVGLADTHYVDKASPNPQYPYTAPDQASHTIQAAIDAASDFGGGDVEILWPDTYYENIHLRSSVWLYGYNARIKPAAKGGTVVTASYIEDAGIDQCRIEDGDAYEGGGILVDHSTNFTVTACSLAHNSANLGAGICFKRSTGRVSRNWIYDNHFDGVACDTAAVVVIDSNEVFLNSGVGILCRGDSVLATIGPDNHIHDNTGCGGIACILGAEALIDSNIIEDNTASWWCYNCRGGGICVEEGSAIIMRNEIAWNEATSDFGGGVCCYNVGSDVIIGPRNHIHDNTAPWGGGIACVYNSDVLIDSNTVEYNTADEDGGGIWVYYSSPTIQANEIRGNQADRAGHGWGGGIAAQRYLGWQKGYDALGNRGEVTDDERPCQGGRSSAARARTLRDAPAYAQTLDWSGPISSEKSIGRISGNLIIGNDAYQGGGIACSSATIARIDSNEIFFNSAWEGGGIWCCGQGIGLNTADGKNIDDNTRDLSWGGISCQNGTALLIAGNTIEGNRADSDGGGIHIDDASANIHGNVIRNNEADQDDDAAGNGGGLFGQLNVGQVVLVDSNLIDHCWAVMGGGMAVAGGTWIIWDNTFINNLASPGFGGAVYVTSALAPTQVSIGGDAVADSGNTFYNNGAVQGGGAVAIYPGPAADAGITARIQGNTIGAPGQGNSAGVPLLFDGLGGGIYVWNTVGSTSLDVLIGGANNKGSLCEYVGLRLFQYGNIIQGNGRQIGPLCEDGVLIGPVVMGGGIAIRDEDGDSDIEIVGNLIGGDSEDKGNVAVTVGLWGAGGGVWCRGQGPTLVGKPETGFEIDYKNCIQGNQAQGVGAVGGGVCLVGQNAATSVRYNIVGGDLDEEGNTAQLHGGGVYVASCSLQVGGPDDYDVNRIKKNTALEGSGGGICCNYGANPLVEGNDLIANSANGSDPGVSNGGGIACLSGSAPQIYGNEIFYNESKANGGGIYCRESSPVIGGTLLGRANTINANLAYACGGAIGCDLASRPSIRRNSIDLNEAMVSGGGIWCDNGSDPYIRDNRITRNVAGSGGGEAVGFGGGIAAEGNSSPTVSYNIIAKCRADSVGGGVALTDGSISTMRHNTIYHNDAVITGGGMFWDETSTPSVVLNIFRQYGCFDSYAVCARSNPTGFDSNDVWNDIGQMFDLVTGINPGGIGNINAEPLFCADSANDFTLADNSPCLLSGGVIIGAEPVGGCGDRIRQTILVPDDYFTIQEAIDAANYGDVVQVRAGTYTENIVMRSGIILTGEIASDGGPDTTIIDGGGGGIVVDCSDIDNRAIITGFTIRNGDTGVACMGAEPYIVRNLITLNSQDGVRIVGQPAPWIEHNTIVNNGANGVYISESPPVLSHNIIVSNAGAGVYGNLSSGSVVWIPNLRGNDVWGNDAGNYAGDMGDRTGENGNISEDPQFLNPTPPGADYRIASTSPCTPANSPTQVVIGAFPVVDLSGIVREGPPVPGDRRSGDMLPVEFGMSCTNPNRLGRAALIRFQLPAPVPVGLVVYDISGRLVRTLIDSPVQPGYYTLDWDGKDQSGRLVSSGVYLCLFRAGEFRKTQKIILVE